MLFAVKNRSLSPRAGILAGVPGKMGHSGSTDAAGREEGGVSSYRGSRAGAGAPLKNSLKFNCEIVRSIRLSQKSLGQFWGNLGLATWHLV